MALRRVGSGARLASRVPVTSSRALAAVCCWCAGAACARPFPARTRCADDPVAAARARLDEAGLWRLRIAVRGDQPSIGRGGGDLCFEQAALLAVSQLAMSERDPINPIGDLRALPDRGPCRDHEDAEAVRCYLGRPGSTIGLASLDRPAPSGTPPVAWAFWLEIPELALGRVYWTVVKPARAR